MTRSAPGPPDGPDGLPPAWLGLRPDARLVVADRGRLLVGGHPGRLLRLSPAGAAVLRGWTRGGPVGAAPAAAALARRLLDAGIVHPVLPEPPPADGPAVTVVIPTLDGIEDLERCLAAVRAADPEVPVVVVDDGSADAAAVRRAAARSRARLLRHPARRGAAAARNAGLAVVETPLVAFVDHDVVVPPGWLRRLRPHFADPGVAAVAPRVTAHRPGPGWLAAYEAVHSPLDLGARPGAVGPGRPIPYVPTATLLVRRAAVDRPFDERLPIGEDVDLVWRLAAAGWTVRHVPEVEVAHRHRDTVLAFARRRRLYARSVGLLSRRHPGALPAARVSPWLAAAWLLLAARRPVAAAAAVTALRPACWPGAWPAGGAAAGPVRRARRPRPARRRGGPGPRGRAGLVAAAAGRRGPDPDRPAAAGGRAGHPRAAGLAARRPAAGPPPAPGRPRAGRPGDHGRHLGGLRAGADGRTAAARPGPPWATGPPQRRRDGPPGHRLTASRWTRGTAWRRVSGWLSTGRAAGPSC